MQNRRNIYFYYSRHDTELVKKMEVLYKLAEENQFNIVENSSDANIIISVGGDGAFLQAVRKTGFRHDALYTGITRTNESGLYCDFNMDNFNEMLHIMQNEEMEVRRFPVLNVQVNNRSEFKTLNEISVRSSIIKSIVIDVFIDNEHFETFRGDGLIVATPTGSTGYNKSLNGAVIDPKIPLLDRKSVE